MNEIRQGDVVLIPMDDVMPPETAQSKRDVVLAEGEITGHVHRLSAEAGVLEWQDAEHGRMVWVVGTDLGELSHEDHDPTPVAVVAPQTAYKVGIQRELTLSGQWQQVRD